MEPLVSIILPVYNVEKYLPACMESVLAQTYRNLEIILVDDGSRDASPRICDSYAERYTNVTVVHQINAGVASARNRGLAESAGEYIFLLDSDDCIHPRLLEIAVKTALKEKEKLVQVELEIVPEQFSAKDAVLPENYKIHHFDRLQALCNLDEDNQEFGKNIRLITSVVWGKLYHRTVFDKVKFKEGVRIHEDQMIIHRLLAEAGGMCFIELALYYYRNNSSSLIRSEWKPDKLYIIECYRDRLQCALELEEDGGRKQELINLVYRRYLICIIRNYGMALRHMKGKEKEDTLIRLMECFKKERKGNYGARLGVKDQILMYAFSVFPKFCIKVYPN